MTKEMRQSHFVDVLAHDLGYYSIMTKSKLGEYGSLCYRNLLED